MRGEAHADEHQGEQEGAGQDRDDVGALARRAPEHRGRRVG